MTDHGFIEEKVLKLPLGSVFIISDFTGNADYDNARKVLIRLEDKGAIRRILPGIYDRPVFSKIINEYSAPNINEVAEAIARKNNWKIVPSGNVALNLLGLSTQVPANWEYISSGPSNSYQINNITINFVHRANKELSDMSRETALIIQALKTLGKDNISDNVRAKISASLTETSRKRLAKEAKQTTAWIYEEIKKVLEA